MRHIETFVFPSGFVRIKWQKSDGGIHMQGIAPGEDIDLHLNAVNADMENRGLEKMPPGEVARLKGEVAREHTPDRVAAYRQRQQ